LFIFPLADFADLADSISPFLSSALGIVAKILPCQGLAGKIAADSPTRNKKRFLLYIKVKTSFCEGERLIE